VNEFLKVEVLLSFTSKCSRNVFGH